MRINAQQNSAVSMIQIKSQKCAYCLARICDFCIKCNECSDVLLCIECFLNGAEGGRHQRTHGYALEKILTTNNDSLFESSPTESAWHSGEELKLLDAVETYGYGNWNEVSACMNNRSPFECMKHYERFYITGCIGSYTKNAISSSHGVIDHTNAESSVIHLELPSVFPEDQHLLGYMPYRDEFEYEHNNSAEKVIAAVPFGNIIDDLHRELQLNLVDIYNRHLEARFLRHSVAREHGLVTHLMRDLRSGQQRKRRTGQSFRGIGGFYRKTDRRVFRRRSYKWSTANKRRKPGCARLPALAARRGRPRKERKTEISKFEHFNAFISLSHSTIDPDEAVTCDSNVKAADVNKSELAILELTTPSPFPNLQMPRSRSFDNLNAAGDELNPFDIEGASCTTCLLCCREMMGGRLEVPIRTKLKDNCVSSVLPLRSLTHCSHMLPRNGSSSSDNADSGIGSGDSCAHSISSTTSLPMDPFAPTLSSFTPSKRIPLRRPRSNSVSYEGKFVPNWTNSKSCDLSSLRQQRKLTSCNVATVEVARWVTNGKSRSKCSGLFPKLENSGTDKIAPSPCRVAKRLAHSPIGSEAMKTKPMLLASGSKKTVCEAAILDYPWLCPFIRFMSKTDANTLMENLSREEQLRSEIRQLMDHHKRGVYCMNDVHLQPTVRPVQNSNASLDDNVCTQHVHFKSLNGRSRQQAIRRTKHIRSNARTMTKRLPGRFLNANRRRSTGQLGPGRPRLKHRKNGPGRPRTRF